MKNLNNIHVFATSNIIRGDLCFGCMHDGMRITGALIHFSVYVALATMTADVISL